ncbi:MAG TPA: hypothetical protein VGN18_20940 [Jatrophihabitans sp.]|uniref:hypothetical protein n=1 Tax=Jatrophihabitans sp. TaxID=1932789 RepID=UPI002DF8175B|nr:hypothetical protein [Jatrophihabitans sp.]
MSELIHVTRGVWRTEEAVADLRGRVAAIVGVYAVDTVVSGSTAARLHDLWLPDLPPGPVELIVHPDLPPPTSRPGGRRGGVRARRQRLRADEITLVDGIPVTTPARTWIDLADRLAMPDLVALGDCALRRGAGPEELQHAVTRAAHCRGVVSARAALTHLDGRFESRPESHMRYALVSAGLPAPAVNQPIYDEHGQWLARPDLSYDDVRLALEYNGADHAKVDRMRRDIDREFDIGSRGGWRTETFGPTQVFRRPDQMVAYVRWLRRELDR